MSEVVSDIKKIAEKAGKEIRLACAFPYGPNASSKRGISGTDWIKIEQADYDQCLDTRDYRSTQYR